MKVKVKKLHPDAVIPKYAKVGDAGLDLTAVSVTTDEVDNIVYNIGLSFEIPEGYVGLICPRSSISKLPLNLANSVGVIDSGYRGEVICKFRPTFDFWSDASERTDFQDALDSGSYIYYDTAEHKHWGHAIASNVYAVSDRVAQLVIIPYPQIDLEETEDLSVSERGTDGFGSTN